MLIRPKLEMTGEKTKWGKERDEKEKVAHIMTSESSKIAQ
jgi:hypothetical protein